MSRSSALELEDIEYLLKKLFPFYRGLSGEGNTKTFEEIRRYVPLSIIGLKPGEKVHDWIVPPQWAVSSAYIADKDGNKIVDFDVNPLHLVVGSVSINKELTFAELSPRLYRHKTISDAIPYRTNYYGHDWGFCITHDQYEKLKIAEHLMVVIDSRFDYSAPMEIGELLIPGKTEEQILISTYICHPSLANDNLSGIVLTTKLARWLSERKNHYTYRIVWCPETIGAIAYTALREKFFENIYAGIVIATVGGPGKLGVKFSWDKKHPINYLVNQAVSTYEQEFIRYPFDILGSDERQYSSQAYKINCVTITKDKYYEYPEYHSSADDLSLVKSEYIQESLEAYKLLIDNLENDQIYDSTVKNCEPFLKKHSLAEDLGGGFLPEKGSYSSKELILWLNFYCDGSKRLSAIAQLLNINFNEIVVVAKEMVKAGIIRRL